MLCNMQISFLLKCVYYSSMYKFDIKLCLSDCESFDNPDTFSSRLTSKLRQFCMARRNGLLLTLVSITVPCQPHVSAPRRAVVSIVGYVRHCLWLRRLYKLTNFALRDSDNSYCEVYIPDIKAITPMTILSRNISNTFSNITVRNVSLEQLSEYK